MKVLYAYRLKNNALEKLPLKEFKESKEEKNLLNVYPVEKEELFGFGGAITDSAAYNYSLLKKDDKRRVLEYLFGETGLRYNICRVCIGSSDFAREEYCYVQKDDFDLKTFSVEKDEQYIIPFIKDVLNYTENTIYIYASPWSPPAFMKTVDTRFRGGKLKEEYYELYAEYIVRFLKAYEERGINISALTLQNEPNAAPMWESCVFTAKEEAAYARVLKAELNKNGYSHVKLFAWDHNKERLYERADEVFSETGDIVDGAAFHWYSGEHFGAIKAVKRKYPQKIVFASEFCLSEKEDKTDTKYFNEILGDIDAGANAICEWNLLLDERGGPYHNRAGGCDAPVRIDSVLKKIKKSGIYNEIYMFSHFIQRGAKSLYTSSFTYDILISAVKNPNGAVVVNIVNMSGKTYDAKLYFDKQTLDVEIDEKAKYVFVFQQ